MSNDRITEADIRLYVSLIRFDEAYIVYFKTSRKAVREYPNMFNYLRELYQIPELAATTSIENIKRFYFTAHPSLNYYRYAWIYLLQKLHFVALFRSARILCNFSPNLTIEIVLERNNRHKA